MVKLAKYYIDLIYELMFLKCDIFKISMCGDKTAPSCEELLNDIIKLTKDLFEKHKEDN